MEKNRVMIIAVMAVLILMGAVGAYKYLGTESTDTNTGININSSQAVDILMSDHNVSEYYSTHFKVEGWRITATSLVSYPPGSTDVQEGTWKVEIMERSCACSGIKDLYVIEGYVSASSGKLLNVSTGPVLESEYDKNTCASTACH